MARRPPKPTAAELTQAYEAEQQRREKIRQAIQARLNQGGKWGGQHAAKATPAKIARAEQMRRRGRTIRDIANAIGMKKSQVAELIRHVHPTMRNKPGQD